MCCVVLVSTLHCFKCDIRFLALGENAVFSLASKGFYCEDNPWCFVKAQRDSFSTFQPQFPHCSDRKAGVSAKQDLPVSLTDPLTHVLTALLPAQQHTAVKKVTVIMYFDSLGTSLFLLQSATSLLCGLRPERFLKEQKQGISQVKITRPVTITTFAGQ